MRGPPVFSVGLTGGIASGKSHVASLFENLGVPLLDADQVSRLVVAPPSPVLTRIAERFGGSILLENGALDRPKLRAIVFADTQSLRDLEAITHPAIRDYIGQWRRAQTAPYCMIANAILIESGMHSLMDRVLVVDAPDSVQISRLLRRDKVTEEAGRQMIAAQTRREERLGHADDIIDNSDETRDLAAAIRRLHGNYRRLHNRH